MSVFEDENYFSILEEEDEITIGSVEFTMDNEETDEFDTDYELYQIRDDDEDDSSIGSFDVIESDEEIWDFTTVDIADAFEQVEFEDTEHFSDGSIVSQVDERAVLDEAIAQAKSTMSSEILFSVPEYYGKQVFTGLVDSGCSNQQGAQEAATLGNESRRVPDRGQGRIGKLHIPSVHN